MCIKQHFKSEYNRKKIHIEQLLILQKEQRDNAKLNAKIERERLQLSLLDEIWDVS